MNIGLMIRMKRNNKQVKSPTIHNVPINVKV